MARHQIVRAALLIVSFVPAGSAQVVPAFTCIANAGVPPLVRAEGLTELVGDIVLNCHAQGLLPPAGSIAPAVNIQAFLNTNMTSRLIASSYTEALLLIDEPEPEEHFLATQPLTITVGCTASSTCPTIFPGQRVGPNSILWLGVPIVSETQTIRLTNIRANVAQLGGIFGDDSPVKVQGTIRITPFDSQVSFPPVELNFSNDTAPSFHFTVEDTVSILGSAGYTGRVGTLVFQENFASGFKKENCAVSPTTPKPSREDIFTVNICRTNLLYPFVSANAGFDTGLIVANTSQDSPWSHAGVSRGGTQLQATFNNIPGGMRMFVATRNEGAGTDFFAQLLQSPDSDEPARDQGNGFTPMQEICPDYRTTGACTTAWRILGANPDAVQIFRFGIDGIRDAGTPSVDNVVTTVTPALGPAAAAWDREGSTAVLGFQGYVIAQANFQLAHGFAFISDLGAQRLAQGYLALVIPQPDRPELDRSTAAWEVRGEQLGQIRALDVSRVVLLGDDKQQAAIRRFELTSEGYLPQRLRLSSAGPDRLGGFTITVETGTSPGAAAGESWLQVEKIGEATPVTLVLTVDPEGLAPGTYQGTITATPTQPAGGPATIPVELVVPPPGPRVRTFGVTNAGSYSHSVVAPGEAVVVFGEGFGPASLAGLELEAGAVKTEIGQTSILFDGEPAPMIYSIANQASCFVPFSVEGKKFVEMVVEYQGVASPPVRLAVLAAKPALLTSDQSGGGIGAILNQDNSYNSLKAAKPGEVIQIFGIGGGQTTPLSIGGRLQTGEASYNLPIRVLVDGVEVETIYAGPAPGLVEGVFQINLRLPENIRTSAKVPITIYFGDELQTQPGVTVWVE